VYEQIHSGVIHVSAVCYTRFKSVNGKTLKLMIMLRMPLFQYLLSSVDRIMGKRSPVFIKNPAKLKTHLSKNTSSNSKTKL